MRRLEEKGWTQQTHVMRKIGFVAVCVRYCIIIGFYVLLIVILIRVITRKFLDSIVCRDPQMLKKNTFFCVCFCWVRTFFCMRLIYAQSVNVFNMRTHMKFCHVAHAKFTDKVLLLFRIVISRAIWNIFQSAVRT